MAERSKRKRNGRGLQVHCVRLSLHERRTARPLPYLQGEEGEVREVRVEGMKGAKKKENKV